MSSYKRRYRRRFKPKYRKRSGRKGYGLAKKVSFLMKQNKTDRPH